MTSPPTPPATPRLTRLAGMIPPRPTTAARTPFVLLVVALLAAGMLALLLFNAALNEGSFELSELRRETQRLADEEQELQAEVDAYTAPDALAERARELGLVPGGPPAFLAPDGSVVGEPQPAPTPRDTAGPEDREPGGEQGTDASTATGEDRR